MSATRELFFSFLVNALLQIAIFAVAAKFFSRLVGRLRPKHQHCFYLSVLALCLGLPIANTFWNTHSTSSATILPQLVLQTPATPDAGSWPWLWKGTFNSRHNRTVGPQAENLVIGLWFAVFLYQLIKFGRGLWRVHSLRRDAQHLSPEVVDGVRPIIGSERVALLASEAVDHPVTIGFLRPAVILPHGLLPRLEERELAAIMAHEGAHIRRNDFAVHVVCQALSLPVALHPGIRYVMSKISQTRELACDEHAAVQLGERRIYARALLRLASLCLQLSSGSAVELGIFHEDNLEDRITRLIMKTKPVRRASLLVLLLAVAATFTSGAILARAMSLDTAQQTVTAQRFAGTWKWMFQGRPFATMTLMQGENGLVGTATESRIALNDDGTLKKADSGEDTAPKPIQKVEQIGNVLRITVADNLAFTMTMKDTMHAQILPTGAPPNMKPIVLERAH